MDRGRIMIDIERGVLYELLEDLKCCGNCKKYLNSSFSGCEFLNINPCRLCRNWEYDNVKKSDRMIGGDYE